MSDWVSILAIAGIAVFVSWKLAIFIFILIISSFTTFAARMIMKVAEWFESLHKNVDEGKNAIDELLEELENAKNKEEEKA